MKISKRLKTICDFIEPGSDVIDVGCDHGLVSIYLVLEKQCRAVCTDINEKALMNAKNNIAEYNLSSKIKTVVTDGLQEIETKDKTILICGMGTNTIMHIINHVVERDMREIIIQSNNDWEILREYMFAQGFYITDEKYLVERSKHYVFMKFKVGNMPHNEDDILIGPVLKETNQEYLEYLLQKRKELLSKIPKKYLSVRRQIKQEKRKIDSYLKKIKKCR